MPEPLTALAETASFEHELRPSAPSLISRLAEALADQGVTYCQWKGHWKQRRWSSGQGDIDLLVDRSCRQRFQAVLHQHGFKAALTPPETQIPGVESYLGYDPKVRRFVHLHAHYRLVLGPYWRTTYRLPLEVPLLASAVPGPVFRIPAPELELIVFVVRMVQRFSIREALLPGPPRWLQAIQAELSYLEGRVDRNRLLAALAEHLPSIEPAFFWRSLRSLRTGASRWEQAALRRELHHRVSAHARRPPLATLLLTLVREVRALRTRQAARPSRVRLAGGGTIVALVGGDGAGKSTCAGELHAWLRQGLATKKAHLGKPPKSILTLAIGAMVKIRKFLGRMPGAQSHPGSAGYLELLRHVCTARDRYRLYLKVGRFAAAGGVAICERYPIPENYALAGPCIDQYLPGDHTTRLARALRDVEARYYRRILPPDLLVVLKLDPELAARRKVTEPADYVRSRTRIVWETDWSRTRARIIDAAQPLPEVVSELKSLIWAEV